MENVRFHITCKGIVIYKHKILILKRVRASSDGLGYWELPGGGLEYGESPEKALIREVKEETGLDIKVLKPVYTFTAIRPNYQTVGIGFLSTPTNDHVVLSHEHTEYKFVDSTELKDYINPKIYDDIILSLKELKELNIED